MVVKDKQQQRDLYESERNFRLLVGGVADPRYGVTSLVDLGLPVSMEDVDIALRLAFAEVFGTAEPVVPRAAG